MSLCVECSRPLSVHSLRERRACRGVIDDAADEPDANNPLTVALRAHGLASAYERGCQCETCTAAHMEYRTSRYLSPPAQSSTRKSTRGEQAATNTTFDPPPVPTAGPGPLPGAGGGTTTDLNKEDGRTADATRRPT